MVCLGIIILGFEGVLELLAKGLSVFASGQVGLQIAGRHSVRPGGPGQAKVRQTWAFQAKLWRSPPASWGQYEILVLYACTTIETPEKNYPLGKPQPG